MPRVIKPGACGLDPDLGQVRSISILPDAALTARVHDEVGETGAAPEEPIVRKSAAAAIANVLHDTGQRLRARSRQEKPPLDRLTGISGKSDVENVNCLQPKVNRFKASVQRMRPGFGQALLPKSVKIRLFAQSRPVPL